MNTPKHFQIPITTPLAEFKNHLEDPDNHRIFFNGKFGTGKTHFLNEFFNETNDFKAIHLYPVNYQVSSNEDIFELIKYDILLELVSLGWLQNNEEFSNLWAFQSYALYEGDKILSRILRNIPKLGKALKVTEEVVDFFKGFKTHKAELNKTEIDIAGEFAQYIESRKGSAYETDAVTNIICNAINENSSSKLCLIIDDLDRIDPEHIFRVLNVFSAHFDLNVESENKFGFAKIIVVGDIDNIRNIFKAKYGMDADFNGYVDKFYSKAVFNFDNRVEVRKKIEKIIEDYITSYNINSTRFASILQNYICPLLENMLQCQVVNLRDLQRLFILNYNWNNISQIYQSDNLKFTLHSFTTPYITDFLFHLFGADNDKFIEILSLCEKRSNNFEGGDLIVAQLLLFEKRNQINQISDKSSISLNINGENFELNVQVGHSPRFIFYTGVFYNSYPELTSGKNLFKFMKNSYLIVKSWIELRDN